MFSNIQNFTLRPIFSGCFSVVILPLLLFTETSALQQDMSPSNPTFIKQKEDPAYTSGSTSGLNSSQIEKLRSLKTAVAVPTWLPVGFKLSLFSIEEDKEQQLYGYTLIYESSKGASFTIQSANDGLGDVSNPVIFGRNPYFENRLAAGYDLDDGQTLFVSWIGSKKKYQPAGASQQFYSLVAKKGDVSLRTALRIMASLRYLRRQ
ncbi:MAG TPA: hypothetical protein VNK26_04880 [Pyrinomonadaceae bacterium]|nr:hypothetical protein [Pyrinomonadaceae bacterium]